MGIATLIAVETLPRGTISVAADALAQRGLVPCAPIWIEPGTACDLPFTGDVAGGREALHGLEAGVDIFVQSQERRRKRLLVADMDSTMITVECIDELADYAGLKPEVAAITERAMRGEIDFAAALAARVALLKGMPVATIDDCYRERVRLMPGAETLVATMRAHASGTLLVSGGFTMFADRVATEIGFEEVVANRLEAIDGVLTGAVLPPIVDGARKADASRAARSKRGLRDVDVLAVGDGANDLAMIEAAGLGVAYRAKPLLAAAADARVAHGDLTVLLYAQGYPRSEWIAG